MKVFILEDDPERIRWFRGRLFKHDLTIVDSCEQVDEFKPPYDLVLLDHDLGGRQLGPYHPDNGANFVETIKDRIDCPVVVHSYNRAGALKMLDVMKAPRETWKPFRGTDFNAALDAWDGWRS